MADVKKRAVRVAGAALFAFLATPMLSAAQSDDPTYNSIQDVSTPDAATEDVSAPDLGASLSDFAMMPPAPRPFDATPGFPKDDFEYALSQAPSQTANTPPSGIARVRNITDRFEIHPDGSTTVASHIEVQLLSAQAVQEFSQPALPYSETMDDLQIKDAYTLKRDGTRIDVPPGAILVRQKSMPQPYFTDYKEKVILYPNVEAGDTLVYDIVLQSQPPIPGQFYYGTRILRSIEVDDETATFVTPKDRPLFFDLYGLDLQKSTEGDKLVYSVHYANHAPVLELPQFLSELDWGVRAFASSVASYDAMAEAYAPLALPKTAVTPTILAKANEITEGVTDRREQARRLYEWVSGHIRYIALLLGDGGLVPHNPDSTLTNAYGDCKDHAVLYSALLRAKGIRSELVLINGSNGYFLPHVPEMGAFNHMIVWLPEFQIYADTTSNTTPFGVLPTLEYGKSAVHIGGNGPALRQVPVLAERDATYTSTSNIVLTDDGKLSTRQTATGTGAISDLLRTIANGVNAAGTGAFATNLLKMRKFSTATGTISFPPTAELTPRFTYSSAYEIPNVPPGNIKFAMPEGLNIVSAYSSAIFGPIAISQYVTSDSVPCFSGTVNDEYSFQFPATRRPLFVPQDGRVQTANIDYRSHWSVTGNTISVHRELHAHFDKAVCTGAVVTETRNAIVNIARDYSTLVLLKTGPAS
jgi:transglutaminase-like putative cysteine protease